MPENVLVQLLLTYGPWGALMVLAFIVLKLFIENGYIFKVAVGPKADDDDPSPPPKRKKPPAR